MNRFEIEQCALLVIDVQGRLAELMHEKEDLFSHLEIMLKAAALLEIPIHWFEQYPKGLGATKDSIKALLGDAEYFEKMTFSGCGAEGYMDALKASGKTQCIVTGIETHVCVYQTTLDLLANNYQVKLNQQAVSSRLASNKALGLANMQRAGAEITSTEMILFELMRSAEHPQFKALSKLLK